MDKTVVFDVLSERGKQKHSWVYIVLVLADCSMTLSSMSWSNCTYGSRLKDRWTTFINLMRTEIRYLLYMSCDNAVCDKAMDPLISLKLMRCSVLTVTQHSSSNDQSGL